MVSQTELPEPDASLHPRYAADIMSEIALCQSTLTAQIEAVQLDMGIMQQDVDIIRSHVTEMKQRVSHTEDMVIEHSSAFCSLQTK